MPQSYDAIVIGAGVIGAAVGLELARTGRKTLNIDRQPAAGYGSTASSCAIIRVYYSTLDGTALAYDAYHDWLNWADYLQMPPSDELIRFNHCGTLLMKTPANEHCRKTIQLLRRLDIPFEEWTADDIAARLPPYTLDSFAPAKRLNDPAFGQANGGRIEGGLFTPAGGYVNDPSLAARNLMDAAIQAGGEFRFNAEVTAIRRHNDRVAGIDLASSERIDAPILVNVAGPHSSKVNAMAGTLEDMTITTRPLRHEVVHAPSPAGFDFETNGLVVSDSDVAVYARPETGGKIALGSEDPTCDPKPETADPDDFDRHITDQGKTQLYRYAQRLPDLPIPEHLSGVADLYDVTEDWLPIYDKSSLPGYYMAIGTSGNQFKNAPAAGKLMACLIDACESGHDHDVDPVRFALEYVDHTLDLSSFSRRRQINPDSSFSVLG